MANYAKHISPKVAKPQMEQAREDEVANNAGGYVFTLDPWKVLDRFLILGCEGGSYYASEKKMVIDNAKGIKALIGSDGQKVVNRIVEISKAGRAPKNDPALFVLAMCAAFGNDATKKLAFASLPAVARIGTHLFTFVDYVDGLRGWGYALRNAIKRWYLEMEPDRLALQLAKYQSRTKEGSQTWSHRDLLRKCHIKPTSEPQRLAFRWAVGKASADEALAAPGIIPALEKAKKADAAEVVNLIDRFGLPRECIPSEHLTSRGVWEALLTKMPMMAMVRNLGVMTKVGLIAPMQTSTGEICARLRDAERIKESHLHPLSILTALKTYSQGHGMKGKSEWTVNQPVCDALNDAFYLAFANAEPTNKRIFIGLDVSGSMSMGNVAGSPLTPREAAAALAMVTARTEPNYHIMAFGNEFVKFPIGAKDSLQDVVRKSENLGMSGTDCALPMVYAMKQKMPVDAFIVITDSETWAGSIHPFQALAQYRKMIGINAKLIVLGMTASSFTIADPTDSGMLDIVGFDSATPGVMAEFISGRI